ncbi:MAG: tetratricopeptide repeat protein [Muribaculaceae bacterium]
MATCVYAQNKLVDEVKSEIGSMSANSGTFNGARSKIKAALTNEESKGNAATWYIAGKASYGYYDKCTGEKAIGKQVDDKEMGKALLEGYDYFMKALELDKVPELEKDGTPKVDKKTGEAKYKTKYSKDILSIIAGHVNDFYAAGNGLYDAKDYSNAAKCWGVFCDFQDAEYLGKFKPALADTTVAQMRFYEGVAAWQAEELQHALEAFEKSRKKGYTDKDVFDYALSVAAGIPNSDETVVAIAKEAYPLYGNKDNMYVRIIVNDLLNKEKYDDANQLLDKTIAENPNNEEYLDLKGVLMEQQNKIDEAIEYFKKAVTINPDYAKGNFDLGRMYFNKAVKVQEENPSLNSAQLKSKTEPFYREALPYLEKCHQLDKDNGDCKRALLNIYYQLNEEDKLNALEQE